MKCVLHDHHTTDEIIHTQKYFFCFAGIIADALGWHNIATIILLGLCQFPTFNSLRHYAYFIMYLQNIGRF